jgi:hypothetical protein
MDSAIINELGNIAGGFMGFVYTPAMVLGIGAFGVWMLSWAWEAIERKYRALRVKANTERH